MKFQTPTAVCVCVCTVHESRMISYGGGGVKVQAFNVPLPVCILS